MCVYVHTFEHVKSHKLCTEVKHVHQIQKRQVLEEAELLDTRISALEEDLDEVESSEEEDEDEEKVSITCLIVDKDS